MAKGFIEKDSTHQFQNQVEDTAEAPRQETRVETDDLEGRNLRVKKEMARELKAMGFGERMVERLLNIGAETGTRKKKSQTKKRQEA